MITLGFNNKFSGWIRTFIALIIGFLMVTKPGASLEIIVKVLASFLIASAVITIIYGYINRARGALTLMAINACICFVVGVILFIFPRFVADIILFLIGIALIVSGIWEIIVLATAHKALNAKLSHFILPVLCIAGGIILLSNTGKVTDLIIVIAGIAIIIYGISEFIATWKMNRALKARELKYNSFVPDDDDIKETEYTKVD